MPIHYICTYGTLRKGGSAASLMGLKTKWEKTITIPGFILVDLGRYPGAIKTNDNHRIVCDLFRIRDQMVLKTMDDYEGYSPLGPPKENLYKRVSISRSSDHPVTWLYVYNDKIPSDALRIPSGDWLVHTQGKAMH